MEVYILVELYQCFEEEGKSSHQIVTTKVCLLSRMGMGGGGGGGVGIIFC